MSAEDFKGGASLLERMQAKLDKMRGKKVKVVTPKPVTPPQTTLPPARFPFCLSQAGLNFIITYEVGSEDDYNRIYCHPTVPGADSGITIGIGYDLGYVSSVDFTRDWLKNIPDNVFRLLRPAIGLTKFKAEQYLVGVKDLVVPWEAACRTFSETTIQQEFGKTRRLFGPSFESLSDSCKTALVSLVYNRGTALSSRTDDNRNEMASIYQAMQNKQFDAIPAYFESMKRLHPELSGLAVRRQAEADLFKQGLSA